VASAAQTPIARASSPTHPAPTFQLFRGRPAAAGEATAASSAPKFLMPTVAFQLGTGRFQRAGELQPHRTSPHTVAAIVPAVR
jgi:hypothetical protein